MDIDIDALEAAARATDNEPWRQAGDNGREVHSAFDDGGDHFVARTVYPSEAAFIAAANPGVVLELIERLRAAELDSKRLDFVDKTYCDWQGDCVFIADETHLCTSMREGLDMAMAATEVSSEH